MESVLKPKKRIFVSLTLASAFLGAVFIYLCWRVALPGLAQISYTLPVLFGSVGIVVVIALLAAVSAIVLAILGFPIIKTFYFMILFYSTNIMNPTVKRIIIIFC